jgi:disulfide bond formation protein DsbB
MTQKQYFLSAALGSAALMLGALAFQHIGGMAPCKLCIWQRYPHVIAIALGALALAISNAKARLVIILGGAIAAATTAGVGIYHAGVERGVFEGPTSCTSNGIGDVSPDELLSQILAAPLVRCDDIAWQMAGISMAGWNAIASLILCALWLMALKRG